MTQFASFSSDSSDVLSFPDHLTGRRVSLALVLDGILQSPAQLRAPIMQPLEFIVAEQRFSTLRSPICKHRRQQALPPLGCVVGECSPCARVRQMLRCAAFACHRLATAPADMHVVYMSWSWAEVVMERVTRGRVKKVQVLLQRRACCAVPCACRVTVRARVSCVCDACCRKRWLVLRCIAAHRIGCIKCAAAFILLCRLLPPPVLQADAAFWTRQ
jgi:hypothetical protein